MSEVINAGGMEEIIIMYVFSILEKNPVQPNKMAIIIIPEII